MAIEREEHGPGLTEVREDLRHIAEAAERDGAQVAAHDQALRSELGRLSTHELGRRREELVSAAGEEGRIEERRRALDQRIAEVEQVSAEPGAEPALAESTARLARRSAERLRAERDGIPAVEHGARAELAVLDHIVAERERLALAAVRLSPPGYVLRELGERPSDPARRRAWDRAVAEIEGYRQRYGVADREAALGDPPSDGRGRSAWEAQRRRLRRDRRSLEREQGIDRGRGMEGWGL